MAAYTLTAAVGTFALTGHATSALYGLFPATGVFQLNPPRDLAQIMLPPAVGTRLLWKNSSGQYYVVIP